MENEMRNMLSEEICYYEGHLHALEQLLQELTGVDCSLGLCLFRPGAEKVQKKLDEVHQREIIIKDILKLLSQYEEGLHKIGA